MGRKDTGWGRALALFIGGNLLVLFFWVNLDEWKLQNEQRRIARELREQQRLAAERKVREDLALQKKMLQQTEASVKASQGPSRFGGKVVEHLRGEIYSEEYLDSHREEFPNGFIQTYDSNLVVYSCEKGTDFNLYFTNSFLSGFAPFETKEIWVPHFILSRRKTYEKDEVLFPGHSEVWQSSYEAYQYLRGDCEDHALALADWLIEMGHDARVVTGNWDGGGHAWVILVQKGKAYLLEATSKKSRFRNAVYPDAALATEYEPIYMFNREKFWVNTGSKQTTDYLSSRWEHRSTYQYP